MKHIEINVIQLLLMIMFIFLFTYIWLPKINIHKTTEYKKIAIKYIDTLDEKNYWQNLYTQLVTPQTPHIITNSYSDGMSYIPGLQPNTGLQPSASGSIGSKTSAHSGSITPRNIDSNDNALVNQFFF